MDIIKAVFLVVPIAFHVIDLESNIVRNPNIYSATSSLVQLLLLGANATYHVGCVGDKSVPTTIAPGNRSAISMAQMPVPVPMSSILFGFSNGARWSSPFKSKVNV